MAASPIAAQAFGMEPLGALNFSDLGAGTAADATNGNSTPNNGATILVCLGTAADTVVVTRPEEGSSNAASQAIVANHLSFMGPFETDIYGPTLNYKAGATTTKVWPVQLAELD